MYLDKITESAAKRIVKRGQVYWCHFGIGVGTEMSKETARPCIVVQNDIGNLKSSNIVVAPITHDTDEYPFLVPFPEQYDKDGKLVLDGQINVANIACVAKSRLGDPIKKDGRIVTLNTDKVDESLAKELGIMWKYKELKDKLSKLTIYTSRVKKERNLAQDILRTIRKELNVENDLDIIESITLLKNDKRT